MPHTRALKYIMSTPAQKRALRYLNKRKMRHQRMFTRFLMVILIAFVYITSLAVAYYK
jgi:hypothetical protein